MRLLIGILLTLCLSAVASAQTCKDCSLNQFGDPICVNTATCKCFCMIITQGGFPYCFSGQICVLGDCIEAEESTLPSADKAANDLAAHPWVMDTNAAAEIRAKSTAMGSVFEAMQQIIREKHLTDGSGSMSTNKDNPADKNGWVRYDLIAKANGMDEIRLTYDVSLVQEQLLIAPKLKKWILYRLGHGSDNMLHHEQIAMGNLTMPAASVSGQPLARVCK